MAPGAEVEGPESPSPRIKVRIESLSDLVFGLALAIGSLFLINKAPQTGQDLAVYVLLFGFGFLIVVMTWLGYSRTMAYLPEEAPFALAANVVLLFVVVLEPYLFYVLESAQTAGLANAASVAYGLDLGGLFFLQGALAYEVVKESRGGMVGERRIHPAVVARFKKWWKVQVVIGAVFAVSALPFFWVSTPFGYLRFLLWSVSFIMFLVGRATRKSSKDER